MLLSLAYDYELKLEHSVLLKPTMKICIIVCVIAPMGIVNVKDFSDVAALVSLA